MVDLLVKGRCASCSGTGVANPVEGGGSPGTCSKCSGTGLLEVAKIDIGDIMDKLNDIKEVVDEL